MSEQTSESQDRLPPAELDAAELRELMHFAADLAQSAGEITLKYFRRKLTPERKRDGSFVTVADREAERHLRACIRERFPHDAILGEEEGEAPGTSGRRWILDPIDGTFSFVHGVPFYGVLVALEVAGEPLVGAVNIPALDELVYAARGQGCFFRGEPARTSATRKLDEALLLTTSFRLFEQSATAHIASALQRLTATSRTWGDCYGYVLVATGRADVMIDPVMNVWDCAPLLPILEEAGGTFTDWRGQRTIWGGNALSTNGHLLSEILEILRQKQ